MNGTRDLTNDGKVNLTDDLQARVDAANAAEGRLCSSAVHFNGIDDPTKKGTQTFYSEGRPFAGAEQGAGRARPGEPGAEHSRRPATRPPIGAPPATRACSGRAATTTCSAPRAR